MPLFSFFCLFIMLSLAAESKSSLGLMSLALISFSDKQSATLVMCNSMARHLNPEQKTKSQKLWLWRKIMSCFSTAYSSVFVLSFAFGYQFYESSHNCFDQKLTAWGRDFDVKGRGAEKPSSNVKNCKGGQHKRQLVSHDLKHRQFSNGHPPS